VEGAHRADEPRDRGASLSDPASAWSGATYERIAEAFAPIHHRIVETLDPRPGGRFLDLACGTGGVALIAARSGAAVTGLDISADQLEKARAAAEAESLDVRFDEGDVENLPYEDGEFDSVASAFGIIFAADHERAAQELTRVSGPGARFAITTWQQDEWFQLGQRLRPDYSSMTAHLWAEEDHVRDLFPEADLRFERGVSTIAAASTDECWELLSSSVAPLKAWLEALGVDERADAEGEYKQLIVDGSLSREYILILGTPR
jgi:SAM-dependent methyltransferase